MYSLLIMTLLAALPVASLRGANAADMLGRFPPCQHSATLHSWDANELPYARAYPWTPTSAHDVYVISCKTCTGGNFKNEVGLQLFVSNVVTGKLVSCPIFPDLRGRPWAVRFLNSTMLYVLMTSGDTANDHRAVSTVVIISVDGGQLKVQHSMGMFGATHDVLVQPAADGELLVTWFQHRLMHASQIVECGLCYHLNPIDTKVQRCQQHFWKKRARRKIAQLCGNVFPIPSGMFRVDDIIQEHVVLGRLWYVRGLDLLLHLWGFPNCSAVLHHFNVTQENSSPQFDADQTHANSIWALNSSHIVVNLLSQGTHVILKPPSYQPVLSFGIRSGAPFSSHDVMHTPLEPPGFTGDFDPRTPRMFASLGHATVPANPSSFIHFSNRRAYEMPDGGMGHDSKVFKMSSDMNPLSAVTSFTLDWEITVDRNCSKDSGGGAMQLPGNLVFVTTGYCLTLHNTLGADKQVVARSHTSDGYFPQPFLRGPFVRILNTSADALCMTAASMYHDYRPLLGLLQIFYKSASQSTEHQLTILPLFQSSDTCFRQLPGSPRQVQLCIQGVCSEANVDT